MERTDLGRVLTEATIENLEDQWAVERGMKSADQARHIVVADAVVDTRITLLAMPTRFIRRLGLSKTSSKRVLSSIGVAVAAVYDAVRLTIQGRSRIMDVVEVPNSMPVLIGRIPLVHLDFVVNLSSRTLIGNPAHGGEHIYELYRE